MSVPTEERCQAIIKYVHDWRCGRRAVADGLCEQHLRLGARVPAQWEHEYDDLGVLLCKPLRPYERRKAYERQAA